MVLVVLGSFTTVQYAKGKYRRKRNKHWDPQSGQMTYDSLFEERDMTKGYDSLHWSILIDINSQIKFVGMAVISFLSITSVLISDHRRGLSDLTNQLEFAIVQSESHIGYLPNL